MIAIGLLIPLAILGGVIAGIAALAKRNDEEPPGGFVRRLVVGALTFGMTVVLAVGIYLLLDVVLGSSDGFARSGSSDVARGLAMTIVGAPAAFLLWRYQLRTLAGPDGRSIVWLLHQTIAAATFSIGTVVALGNGLRFDDFDSGARSSLAFGLAWLAAWVFHEWIGMRRPAPLLPGLPHAVGAGVGLIAAAVGGVGLIDALISQVIESDVLARSGQFDDVVSGLVWTAVGVAVWTWQFFNRSGTDPVSRRALVLGLGVGGGTVLGLGGLTTLVAVALSSITNGFDTEVVGESIGAIGIGFLLWRYHDGLSRDEADVRIGRHLVAGVALIGSAVGIGVLVNAVLALATPAFASANEYELLWGGLAAAVVGTPVWWMTWRPDRHPDPDSGTVVQRTYLTLLAGVAGISGAVALIVLLYQLLEGLLEGDRLGGIVDSTRAPLGFVVATGLITAYHYRRWVASREHVAEPEPMTVERVTFVGSPQAAVSLRSDLGVRVTAWQSAGAGRVLPPGELAEHLRSLDATDALIVEEDHGFRVIRLLRDGDHRPHTAEPQE